jgi:DNA-directed RNA polymerase specialized sigma24 family protein
MENIPEGMSETEVISIIMKVSKRLAPRYVFSGYEIEDIEQEAFLLGISGLKNFDPSRPLENFMHTHINNRLKTFKRDNYFRLDYGASGAQKIQDRKKNLLEPVCLENVYMAHMDDSTSSEAHLNEMLELIDRKLPSHLRRDYLKLQSEASLPKGRRAYIVQVIERIINGEYEDEEN